MKLLGLYPCKPDIFIYKSRNFMKLLGAAQENGTETIYKSRNFMKLLGRDIWVRSKVYLQE